LFDSDGTSLLNTANAVDNSVISGGIAFRGFGNNKFFDTVQIVLPLDHYKCYQAKQTKKVCRTDLSQKCKVDTDCASGICLQKFAAQASQKFDDQFDGVLSVEVKKPKQLCVPVDKTDPNDGVPINDPNLHYIEYQVKGGAKLAERHLAIDQFGEHVLELGKPKTVLVPAAKSADPNTLVAAPDPNAPLDHFVCYQAKHKKKTCTNDLNQKCKVSADCGADPNAPGGTCDLGFTPITSAVLVDQFQEETLEIKKIKLFCAPAVKNEEGELANPVDHLVGYQLKGAKKAFGAHTHDQYGAMHLTTKKPKYLYVPALKDPICGNGLLESLIGEECDDGGTDDGDGCDANCIEEFCGDGVVQPGLGEECEPTDDAACPGLCSADYCRCSELSPVTEDLTTCTPPVTDFWEFSVASGETVALLADTVDAGTAADLCFSGSCSPSSDIFFGDDNFACTFPPPSFSCPQDTFVATGNATCTVEVRVCSAACADPNTANYSLTVTRNGIHTLLTLVGDDVP
jgi:cysteine-rich repeat protein